MSNEQERSPMCAAVADELAELALGVLTGRRRAVVLHHLEGCATCRAEVDQLSSALDALLQVAPSVEPPVGFEVRLFERLGVRPLVEPVPLERARRRARRMRPLLAAAALALLAFVGFGTGWLVAPRGAPSVSASGYFASATLRSPGGVAKGEVTAYRGSPAWVLMTLHDVDGSGMVTCEVTGTARRGVWVGTFQLSAGYGAWGAPVPAGVGHLERAEVLSSGGQVLASATL
jgi:hypothetical protein